VLVTKPATKAWQVRLAPAEDADADRLAAKHTVSKNDVLRRGLRLLALVEKAAADGGRLLLQRRGRNQKPETVEVWLL
jgi:hypothetical protein